MEEKQLVKKFMGEVHSSKGLGIYGIFDVLKALQGNMAELVLVTDDITYVKLDFKCNKCKAVQEKVIERAAIISAKQEMSTTPCPSCGATDYEVIEKDIVDHLQELATMTGARLEVISGKMEEGVQLASLGKTGAILRYRIMQ
jgi:peptide chain release factor subunit 1